MSKESEKLLKQIDDVLDRERWIGYVGGKVEGALNVLFELDMTKEERILNLAKAVGLSEQTATVYVEEREKEIM